ncbi:hypothetical protein [Pedosphaera parvula]|uniref:Uncharacterized protein n=1 Tax=Pedosphaera parvula (strain Ellin514) TaxID=320771 RepID=B9XBI9_PEDPL|nr:hypothetical protein [Pedosphaera parvula]EEF62874.1 hypothetical protein Cflav_PD5509 [Pedosphaera parvula Ellin514]
MKLILQRIRLVQLVAVFGISVQGLASAQSYNMDWFTVDGGGGTSSGGAFSINGTVGQPDAGVLSGGGYTVEGGYWSGVSIIQNTNAPILNIRLAGSNAILSWPVGISGFSLEETGAPDSGLWSPTSQAVLDTDTTHTVTVPAVNIIKCYRLKK